jgi:SAM-dependent methyltransferase
MGVDLEHDKTVDLASVALSYEGFRALARNNNLSANEKIGFPDSYREGFDAAILADIVAKLPVLAEGRERTVVDIGPGCSTLATLVRDLCRERGHRLHLIDSEEMLDLVPDGEGVVKHPGMFPGVALGDLVGRVDAVICYSVLHYIYVDTNLYRFVDETLGLLAPGGRALIGDIPNVSKRRRFFASDTGQRFHRDFAGRDEPPAVDLLSLAHDKIDDAVLLGMTMRAQAAGFDAYLMPQGEGLPMANRRDDILFSRP